MKIQMYDTKLWLLFKNSWSIIGMYIDARYTVNYIEWNDIWLNFLGSIWANNCKKRMMVAVIKLAVVLDKSRFKEKPKLKYEQHVQ